MKLALLASALVVAGLGAAIWWGSMHWSAATAQIVDRLRDRSDVRTPARSISVKPVDDLPAPVARYFRYALKEGQPPIRATRITQAGELRAMDATKDGWKPFAATQYLSPQSPGFVWDASIRMALLLPVRVRDAYADGEASGQVSFLSLVTLAEERGTPELNAGALHRYLAESVWVPTALLPRAGLAWSPIDGNTALATLTDSQTTVSLEFRFSDAGEITSIYTPGRFAYLDGRYQLLPWEGHFRNYQERAAMRIPTEADVEWHLPSGRFPVWRGRIVDVEYELVR